MDKPKRLFNIYGENYGTGFAGNVWDKEHICPGLMTMQGGGETTSCDCKYTESCKCTKRWHLSLSY